MKRHSTELNINISAGITMDKYKRWKERTNTSPSGRHLGHFHALFRPLKSKDDKDRDRLDGIRTEIIKMHAAMLQTAYDNEHVYRRIWIKTKQEGNRSSLCGCNADRNGNGNKKTTSKVHQ
jgi:hypothetical protein